MGAGKGGLNAAPLVLFACWIAWGYSSGPDPRYTGAPGDAPDACASCHLGQDVNSGPGSVRILLPKGNSYAPGVEQHLIVRINDPQQKRWGFQMTARLKSDPRESQAGEFLSTGSFTRVLCDNGNRKPCPVNAPVQFIEHTAAGTRSGTAGGASFEFDWLPPAFDAGPIVLYVAANAANGDGDLTGDHIYSSNVVLTAAKGAPPASTDQAIYRALPFLRIRKYAGFFPPGLGFRIRGPVF